MLLAAAAISGCGSIGSDPAADGSQGALDRSPEKLDGSSSRAFEPNDIERAEQASPEVQEYCNDAVSEAQRIGCLSHVGEGDLP